MNLKERTEEQSLQIAATSDIHWPQFKELFIEALSHLPNNIDLFLLAGDLVYRGNQSGMQPLVEQLEAAKIDCPIFAVFGNDDYDSIKEQLQTIASETITFLDDEIGFIKIQGEQLSIVGSRGVLDQPTYWQARNLPGIRKQYDSRITHLNELLSKAHNQTKHTILLTHYAPTFATMLGEQKRSFKQMGSQRVESLLRRYKPTMAIHGHCHNGKKQGIVGSIPIYNVALPLNGRIVTIEFPPKEE
ncbi:MAG: metallophosphoesterase [Promethearchaeota archaeon]